MMKQAHVSKEIVKIYRKNQPEQMYRSELVDPIIRKELDKKINLVLKKDRDWVIVIDGEEGVGKSVLAQQIALYLDPTFCLDDIVFTADQFIRKIKDIKTTKGKVVLLDEGYNAANARASMTEANRSMIGLATEMRQRNLFIIIVLPSFFDLDKYFALWRCKTLFHVYFGENEEYRRYIVFPKNYKKYLYLNGKKTYNYSKPKSPYPPLLFDNIYAVPEAEYRQKKANAFNTRVVSSQAKKWMQHRYAYIKYIIDNTKLTQQEIALIPEKYGFEPISIRQVGRIAQEVIENADL